jgi:putative SOS response-associated peptidase YedK
MCGRFSLSSSIEKLAEALEVASIKSDIRPRYNIAPTQMCGCACGRKFT